MIEIQFKRGVSNPMHDRIQMAQVFAPNGLIVATYFYNIDGVLECVKSYNFVINHELRGYLNEVIDSVTGKFFFSK